AFEVPQTLIENQARNLLNNFARDLQQRGVDLQTVDNNFIEMAYHQMQSQAERDVRGAMLLEKIAEAEKLEISKEEVDEEIGKLADYYRTTPDEIRDSLEKQGGGATIENNLRTRKSIEALIAKATVVEGEWIDEAAEAQQAVEAAGESEEDKPKKAAKKKTPAKKTAKASGK